MSDPEINLYRSTSTQDKEALRVLFLVDNVQAYEEGSGDFFIPWDILVDTLPFLSDTAKHKERGRTGKFKRVQQKGHHSFRGDDGKFKKIPRKTK